MSEKKAKEKRKEDSKVLVKIEIAVNAAGQMMVSGLPDNPYRGMDMLATASQVACRKYHAVSQEKVSKVIPFKTPLLGPDGKKVN